MSGWLVTGASGMLGTEVVRELDRLRLAGQPVGKVTAAGRDLLDLTDPAGIRAGIRAVRPDVVINCAAWTAVDDAETREEEALAVNGHGVRELALACAEVGARLVHVSTDYVFDGTAAVPYPEDAPPAPVNAYGRTKLAGERAVLELLPQSGYVVRTAWLYGAAGPNFVRTMVRLAAERETVDVVDDQYGQPTPAADLARRLVLLPRIGAPAGIYHGTCTGRTSWYELAREVFALLGADPDRVRPTTSAAYPRPARRPAYSVLSHDRWRLAGLPPMRHWRRALHDRWPLW